MSEQGKAPEKICGSCGMPLSKCAGLSACGQWETGAWELAERTCEAQLIRTDGTVEAGMARIGTRSFKKWVAEVEKALELENPKSGE
jgi:hypothetical protein